jgi:serine/threonine-protein kinase
MRPALALVRPVTAPTPAPAPGSAPDPLLDRVVAAVGDRYDVREEIGRGGMAVVYRAVEVRLQRPVALKVLPPELAFRDGVRARFLREAQTAAQLSHPNIAPVFAAGDDGGVAWLAMALVDGETLGARLARPPRPAPAEAARVLAEVADALAYAHARGVVHRDVKPDNILLDRESGRAVVTDFGIARAAEADERLTATGAALGTPAYMSPEQAMGEQELDGRSDQYALGVVGYQLLTGVLPFQASGATAMLMKHVGEAPRPVRERAPAVPPALAAAIERALAKRAEDRWPTAAAFRDAVRAAATGPAAAAAAIGAGPTDGPRSRVPALPPPGTIAAGGAPAPRPWPVAPPQPPAPPPPPVPPFGANGSEWREAQRAWKEQLREQRRDQRERVREWEEYAREQARAQRDEWREAVRAGALPPVPLPAPAPYGDAPYGAAPTAAPTARLPTAPPRTAPRATRSRTPRSRSSTARPRSAARPSARSCSWRSCSSSTPSTCSCPRGSSSRGWASGRTCGAGGARSAPRGSASGT